MDNKQSFKTFQPSTSIIESEEKKIKIAVIGNSSVGKTALVHRFLYDDITTITKPKTENNFTTAKVINTVSCILEIIDTSGGETTLDSLIDSSNAFILVYSIDTKSTYDNVIEKHNYIKLRKQSEKYSVIIIGNKCDLNNQRVVSEIEAQAYCAAIKVPFLEVSALDKTNVNEAFLFIASDTINKKSREQMKSEYKDPCCISF